MSEDNKTPESIFNNVLQFPVRKKESEAPEAGKAQIPAKAKRPAKKGSKKAMAASVLAIGLLTVAVNKKTFESTPGQTDLASASGGRAIASVQAVSRNAQWEKDLAEKLASAQVRDIASTSIGRSATIEEKLRWGILEEKYTITYSSTEHEIHSILLQDPVSKPAYILDRNEFLTEYGQLFESQFKTAKLKSVEKSDDKTVESYTLYDQENNAKGEARFELDRYKRLISLKVEPLKI